MLKLRDNVYGAINATIGTGDSRSTATIALASGDAARIPPLAAGDFTYLDMINQAGQIERWLVHAVSTASNHIVASGSQLGTVPRAFASGDKFELRWHSGMAQELEFLGGIKSHLTIGGTANALTASIVTRSPSIPDGFEVTGMATAENDGNVTFALTLDSTTLGGAPLATGAKSVRDDLGEQLVAGAITGNKHMLRFKYSLTNDWWILLNASYARRIYKMARGVNNSGCTISGGNVDNEGAQLLLYGDEHVGNPSDIQAFCRVLQAFLEADGNFTLVKDADDSVVLRVHESSTVEGSAVASVAEMQASPPVNKFVTHERVAHYGVFPKYLLRINISAFGSMSLAYEAGAADVSASFDVNNDRVTLEFARDFANSNHFAVFYDIVNTNGVTAKVYTAVDVNTGRISNVDVNDQFVVAIYGVLA